MCHAHLFELDPQNLDIDLSFSKYCPDECHGLDPMTSHDFDSYFEQLSDPQKNAYLWLIGDLNSDWSLDTGYSLPRPINIEKPGKHPLNQSMFGY